MNLDTIQSIMEQLIEQTCSDNLRLYRNDRVCCIETSEGELDTMYLQHLFDTFLRMAKEYRRELK